MAELAPIPPLWIGVFLFIISGLAIYGGIKSIGKVASILVPAMAFFYIFGTHSYSLNASFG